MANVNDDNRSKIPRVGSQRWTRVREAYQSGELSKQKPAGHSEGKRSRRNVLANISKTANISSQKDQFYQLAERVRELQKEIVPDLLLYQIAPTYSPFSPITSNSSGGSGGGGFPTYPHRQSISASSGASNISVPTQRFGLSSRILERAHQIPERFWIDWQQKQMQERIAELEYIKSNLGCNPSSSVFTEEADENGIDSPVIDPRIIDDDIRRKSVLFLHQAQKLANERRTSLARTTSMPNESILKPIQERSYSPDLDDQSSFNFDQRSEETADTAILNDFEKISPEPLIPVQSSPSSTLDRSRLTISLPFTYTNTREHILFPSNYRQMSNEPMLDRIIEVSDDARQTISPTNSVDDVAQIDTIYNLTLLKREDPKKINPLFYTKAILNRSIEFHKFRPISSYTNVKSSKKGVTIFIPVIRRKERSASRSSSPALSFKSARSRLSSIANSEDFDDNDGMQFISVIPTSSSISSRSRSTSPYIISTNTPSHNHNDYPLLKHVSSLEDFSMNDTKHHSRSSSSEEEDDRSFSSSLVSHQRRRKKYGNTSYLSIISTSSSENNLQSLCDSFYQIEENCNNNNSNNNNNNNYNKRTLKTAYNTSINSNERTWKRKQNAGGFRRVVPVNDNNDDDITRSLSSSAAITVADCLIQRQRRKQTRLKRKARSKKRKERKNPRKKERNKKSPLSTTGAEATEASLFQFPTASPPTIDTSVIFYLSEQLRCAERSTLQEKNCFQIQTSTEHQKQQSKLNNVMADGHINNTSNSIPKRKENVRVFVRRRRQQQRKRPCLQSSSSSSNSYETIPSSNHTNVDELISLIQQHINKKKDKTRKNSNIIVVNYKPVYINSRQQKPPQTMKTSTPLLSQSKIALTTDDDVSSATHYSRRRSVTTTSSDGSPLRSTTTNQPSASLDVPDIEDPLMFIEMMYQQLFTEDGQLRSGTEPTTLANCVRQIVTNSRRNSISSPITHRSTSKHMNVNINQQQKRIPSSSYYQFTPPKPLSLSPSSHLISNEHYNSFGDEEEPNTLIQINTDISGRTSKPLEIDHHSQIHAFLDSYDQKPLVTSRTTTSNGFRFSLDDTDNEDFDTFSDLNSVRFNHKPIRTSPSVDEDFTHTDSRLLSSSGYQSLERSSKFLQQQQQKPILSKSYSENDLFHFFYKTNTQTRSISYCSNCMHPSNITMIPPITPSSSFNIFKRIQQPLGEMFMKYLNFLLISKNVFLLPLFIFLLRQRSTLPIGN